MKSGDGLQIKQREFEAANVELPSRFPSFEGVGLPWGSAI
jgi:hypothetical protein